MLNLPWDIMLMILELLDFRALKAFATTMHAIKDSRLGPCTTPEDLINVVMKPRVAQMLTPFCPDLQAFLTLLRDTNARVYGQLPLSLVLGNRHKWTLDSMDMLVPHNQVHAVTSWFEKSGIDRKSVV